MKSILHIIALILFFSLAISCGALKTDKSTISEASKIDTSIISDVVKTEEVVVEIVEKTTLDDKTKIVTKETSYRPIDPTKEATVTTPDGKKHNFKNAEVVYKETDETIDLIANFTKNFDENIKLELLNKSKARIKSKADKNAEALKTDRKAWSSFNLLWIIIPIVIIISWINKSRIRSFFKNNS